MLFGGCAPVAKLLLEEIEPVSLAALLYFGSGIGLLAYILAGRLLGKKRRHVEASLHRDDLVWLGGVILFGGVLAPVTLMFSLEQTPATTAALLLNFEAVATALVAGVWFREAVGRRVAAALCLITLSCIILSWNGSGIFGFSGAALGIMICCLFWALDNNFSRNISSKDPVPTVMIKGLFAGVLSLLLALAIGEKLPDVPTSLVAMAFGFVSYGGVTSVLFLMALRGIGTSRTGSMLAVSPFFGVVTAFLIFSEPPTGAFYLALPIMALGAYLLINERHSHHHHHPAEGHEHRHRHDDGHHEHEHEEGTPPQSPAGDHSHLHIHEELFHHHSHTPDIHHRHQHEEPGS